MGPRLSFTFFRQRSYVLDRMCRDVDQSVQKWIVPDIDTQVSFSDATPAEVRAALIPEEAAEFDQQWREVMAAATETLDLSEVLATLESWRRVARLTAVTGPEAHRAMYRRAAARLTGQDTPTDEPLPLTKARLGL